MNIEEAIEKNKEIEAGMDKEEMPDYIVAQQLGIEALETLDMLRGLIVNIESYKLPTAMMCVVNRIKKPLPSETE